MKKLGFITRNLGSASEVWMYRQLIGFCRFSIEALTWNYFNQDQYPFPNTTTISQLSTPLHTKRIIRFLQKRLIALQNINKPSPYWREIDLWLDQSKPDIILCQFGPVGVEILPFARQRNIPTVCHFHGRDLSSLLNTDKNYKNTLIDKLNSFAAIIVVGSHQKQWMIEHGASPEKVHLIPCGVPVNEFEYIDRNNDQTTKFIAISRLVEKKGLEYTIKSFNMVRDSIECSLDIVGDGPLKENINNLINKSKHSRDIHLLGELPQDEVKKKLYQADIFLQHSITASDGDTEGSPVVIAEASAAALPVVSTFHAGIPDLVNNENTGFLVKEKDYNDMADKMMMLASNPELRVKMGTAGIEHVKRFYNTTDQVKILENVLQGL